MPVRCAADALTVLSLAVRHPLQHETLAFLLDPHGMGGVVVAIEGTVDPDAVLDVVEIMARVGDRVQRMTSLVVATVRPKAGVLPGDVDRWLEASSVAELHGIELLEWYIVAPHGIECPRDLLGEPERWPA
jgi:hypothetical protein